MLTKEQNEKLVRVGRGTPMGELLRRYWHPIAGVSEFDARRTKPIRILGEDLVLFKDLSENFGLIQRRCLHRGADLSFGFVEQCGLRCNYHGWHYDRAGNCISQPFEDIAHPERKLKDSIKAKTYPVVAKGGMLFAYLGPLPIPECPDWEPFSWPDGFAQVVVSEVPCNWFQCQENSIDPVHFEWMHENWTQRLLGAEGPYGPTHLKLGFEEFEYGFVYKRVKQDTDERNRMWTVGRVCLWPNAFFLGEHFEYRVPIDDENTLSVTWKWTRVPREREPYVQKVIPTWFGPLKDERGDWITSHVMNQDFLAWVGQGAIADRTTEHLGMSDRGIGMIRRRFFDELQALERGEELKGVIRDPARNRAIPLPFVEVSLQTSLSTEAIMADPMLRLLYSTYIFQAGQPDEVKTLYEEAVGFKIEDFAGL